MDEELRGGEADDVARLQIEHAEQGKQPEWIDQVGLCVPSEHPLLAREQITLTAVAREDYILLDMDEHVQTVGKSCVDRSSKTSQARTLALHGCTDGHYPP